MPRFLADDQHYSRRLYVGTTRKPYRFRNFVLDCIMLLITSGLWLIWIFVREMRKR